MKAVSSERANPDKLLRVVADEQRRAVLRTLSAADSDTLDYETLTDRVVDQLRSDDATLPRSEHKERVRISLFHTHLPKLADCGLIDNDSDEKTVQTTTGDRTQVLLDCVESLE